MGTLADSFLADLEDLSDDEAPDDEPGGGGGGYGDAHGDGGFKTEGGDDVEMEPLNFDSLDGCSKLPGSERYRRVVTQVDEALAADSAAAAADAADVAAGAAAASSSGLGVVDEGAYQLIVDCNALTVDIDNEIQIVHNFIRDKYRHKFPELESLVMHPIDYARVIKAIGNEMDMTLVELDGVLPSAAIMVVSVTGSTTNGQPLSQEDLDKTFEACDRAMQLDADKRKLVTLVESRMDKTAPNLSAVLGPEVAARLMGVAGGLIALSKMPSCNVQVLGAKRKATAGFSNAAAVKAGDLHAGFIFQCDVIQRKTPPPLRTKAARLVGGKCTLMARVDAFGQDPTGETGRKMHADVGLCTFHAVDPQLESAWSQPSKPSGERNWFQAFAFKRNVCRYAEVLKKIEKWQEPPPAKTNKPLPIPGGEAKKRRGGKRQRAMKERFGASDMRKAANRVGFNVVEEQIGYEGEGLGTLGTSAGMAAASGKLRVQAKATKMRLGKKDQQTLAKYGASGGGGVNGAASSLAFTPIQGIELANPTQQNPERRSSGTDSVFSEFRGFKNVQRQLKGL
jgi:U4/U6 small nuclear ribonucleoprotein PRP31